MIFKVTDDKKFLKLVEATEGEIDQLQISFTKKVKGYKYKMKYRPGWNGEYEFFDKKMRIPFGLWDKLQNVAERYKIPLEIIGLDKVIDFDFNQDNYTEWENNFFVNSDKKPREHQTDTAMEVLKWRRCIVELATSAGKTLLMFQIFAFLKQHHDIKRMLVVVPTNDLIVQGVNDFEEYSAEKTLLKYKMQCIGDGRPKYKEDVDIVLGNYNTLRNLDESFFEGVDCVCIDECLHPSTLIIMSDNSKKEIKDVLVGELVKTINEDTGLVEDKEVEYVYKNLSQHEKMFEVEIEDGSLLKITGNHKVMLLDGSWKRADELSTSDDVFNWCL